MYSLRKSRLMAIAFGLWGSPVLRFAGEGDGGGGSGGATDGGGSGGGSGGATEGGGSGGGSGGATEGGGSGGDNSGGDTPVVDKKVYDSVLRESIKRKEELKALQAELESLKKNSPSQEEIAAFREHLAKKAKEEEELAKKRGEYEKLIQDKQRQHESELAKAKARADEIEARWKQERINNTLAVEIPKYTSANIEDVRDLLSKYITVGEDGSFVIRKNGVTPTDPSTGKDVTLARFVELEIESRDYLAKHKPAGGSGSSANSGRGTGKGGVFTPEDIAAMSPEEYRKHRTSILEQAGRNTSASR